jgi:hypothetical protein
MARYLFIVSREHPTLHAYLVERFAGDTNVRVILDRRRELDADPSATNGHGRSDRRCRLDVDEEVRTRSHAIVSLV